MTHHHALNPTPPAGDPRLLPVPKRLAWRPRDGRGYVVPWFVAEVSPGVFDFRIADESKRRRAVRDRVCWLCGDGLGRHLAFALGPMCAVNRTSSEPPCHVECAVYAMQVCPFLTRPKARRREAGLPDEHEDSGGIALARNPGVGLVWVTTSFEVFRTRSTDGPGIADGWLLTIGPPLVVHAYAEGRTATADELWTSIVTGYPFLADAARSDVPEARPALRATLHQAVAELVSLQLLEARHLSRIDVDMPPVETAREFDTGANLYLGSVDVDNPQEG